MERTFILTEKQLSAILGKISDLPWRQANPIMEVLKNVTENKKGNSQTTKQEKKIVSSDVGGSNGKKS